MADERPPALNLESFSAFIVKYFPFKHVPLSSYKPLPSYYDRNIYFEGERDDELGTGAAEPLVLKICNSGIEIGVVEAMMFFLNAKGISCCCPAIATRQRKHTAVVSHGELLGTETAQSDATYTARVMKYITGEVMDRIEKRYLTPELAYSVGRLAGRIDLELQVYK